MVSYDVEVQGLPPRKLQGNSLWRTQPQELFALRNAICENYCCPVPLTSSIIIVVEMTVATNARIGDLSNYIGGLCDGLMRPHTRANVDGYRCLCECGGRKCDDGTLINDDRGVDAISATILRTVGATASYKLRISGEE